MEEQNMSLPIPNNYEHFVGLTKLKENDLIYNCCLRRICS